MQDPFTLNGGTTVISATTTSSDETFAPRYGVIRVYNAGTVPVHIRSGVGAQTAVLTDMPIAGGYTEYFSVPTNHNTIAGITGSGTATVYVTEGTSQ
jgi:hypothetical protein